MTCTAHSQHKAETTEMIFNTYFTHVYIYFCRKQSSRQNDDAGNSLHILSYCGLLCDNDRCLFVKHTGGKEIIILPNI